MLERGQMYDALILIRISIQPVMMFQYDRFRDKIMNMAQWKSIYGLL